jgi:hypothetical protein
MIRRFNYTNRVRIRRRDARITLHEKDGQFYFDADLRLSSYVLPPESLVFVEAYRQTSWMRFDFGRVGALQTPPDRSLTEFDSPDGILFRVKVTPAGDTHTLLAEADRIPLAKPDEKDAAKQPLLPVKPQKLGDEVFRLDFSEDRPLLLINSDLGDYRAIGMHPAFAALVYPSVFREVLVRVLVVDKHDDDAAPDDWRSQWVRFATLLPGLGELPEPDDVDSRYDWIDKVVAAFAKKIQGRLKFEGFWKGATA